MISFSSVSKTIKPPPGPSAPAGSPPFFVQFVEDLGEQPMLLRWSRRTERPYLSRTLIASKRKYSAEQIEEILEMSSRMGLHTRGRHVTQFGSEAAEFFAGLAQPETIVEWPGPGGVLDPPTASGVELRPYQKRVISRLLFVERGINRSLMGTGKTPMTLCGIAQAAADYADPDPFRFVVFVPPPLIDHWVDEAEKFLPEGFPHQVTAVTGTTDQRVEAWKAAEGGDSGVFIASSEATRLADLEVLKQVEWTGIAVDELSRYKNPKSQRTKGLMSLKSRYFWGLTATPLENDPEELWTLMRIVAGGSDGFPKGFTAFREAFCDYYTKRIYNRYAHKEILVHEITGFNDNVAWLNKLLATITARVPGDVVARELPELTVVRHYADMKRWEEDLAEAIWGNEPGEEIAHIVDQAVGLGGCSSVSSMPGDVCSEGSGLLKVLRLQQAADHPLLLGDEWGVAKSDASPAKLDLFLEVAREIMDAGEQAIVFTRYVDMAKMLADELIDRMGKDAAGLIVGDTPQPERRRVQGGFRETGQTSFLVTTDCLSYGFSAPDAGHVILYDLDFNAAKNVQRVGRIRRQNSARDQPKFAHVMLARSARAPSIDETTLSAVRRKMEMASDVNF